MIGFFSISSFRRRLSALLKVKRGVYAGVDEEICRAFEGCSMVQIRNNQDMLLIDSESVVVKLRMPDKKHHLSKSEGYRLIYLAMKHEEVVVFLDIYPKNGPSQQLDIEDNDLKMLLTEFVSEFQDDTVMEYDLKKGQ